MSTRAGTAASTRLAFQRLIRLLFVDSPVTSHVHPGVSHCTSRPTTTSTTTNPTTTATFTSLRPDSSYTYHELRDAYLQRIQMIHPDKWLHVSPKKDMDVTCHDTMDTTASSTMTTTATTSKAITSAATKTHYFIELQSAWKEYERWRKQIQPVSTHPDHHHHHHQQPSPIEPNFTMFGVGCSFADTPEERIRRNEIMDQACRGFFTDGYVPEYCIPTKPQDGGIPKKNGSWNSPSSMTPSTPLIDDDLFLTVPKDPTFRKDTCPSNDTSHGGRIDRSHDINSDPSRFQMSERRSLVVDGRKKPIQTNR